MRENYGDDLSLKSTSRDQLLIELMFGNQNIKEDRISKMKTTRDFIDKELTFKFRPITCMFRNKFMDLIWDFFDMDDCLNTQTKLKALDELEKIREKLSLQNMFEA